MYFVYVLCIQNNFKFWINHEKFTIHDYFIILFMIEISWIYPGYLYEEDLDGSLTILFIKGKTKLQK